GQTANTPPAASDQSQAQANQPPVPVETTPAAPSGQGTVTLSPFEVNAAQAQGYFTPNTTTGTRLSNNIGDIPSSVTVIDKQQLENTNAQYAQPMQAAARPAAPPPVHRSMQVQSFVAGANLGRMIGDRGSVTSIVRKDSAADNTAWIRSQIESGVPFDKLTTAPWDFRPADFGDAEIK